MRIILKEFEPGFFFLLIDSSAMATNNCKVANHFVDGLSVLCQC